RFRRDGETPKHRLRKRVFHRLALRGIPAARSKGFVGLYQHHARPHPLEGDHLAAAFLSPVETNVVRAESRGETSGIQELVIHMRNLEQQAAGAIVPIDWEVAVLLLQAGGAFFNRGNPCRTRQDNGSATLSRAASSLLR